MERFTRRDYCRWEAKKEKGKDGEKMNREEKKGIGMRKRFPRKIYLITSIIH
jgi:hypothetical protein